MAYIDVDLTLIDIEGDLLPGVNKAIPELCKKYELICWSAGGAEYARTVLDKHGLRKYFSYVLDKPFIVIDDEPATVFSRARVVTIGGKDAWATIWEKIFGKSVY